MDSDTLRNEMFEPSQSVQFGEAPRPLLSIQNVSRTYPITGGEVQALKNATFDIPDGSFTIIYGPSGSGKSTLLNALIGLDRPNEGTVTYDGHDLYAMPVNERAYFRAHTMGMVYQTNYWVNSLNVLENVALPLTFLGFTQRDAAKAAMDSLVRVNMQQHANKYPVDLSGGEQQRVALARALVNNPSYIVADEPTGNLDSQAGDDMIDLLRYFNKKLLRTIILVTHNPVYLPVGDQILTIQDGRVKAIEGDSLHQVKADVFSDMTRRMERWKELA